MIDEHHPDLFLILGYLASPSRRTKLDIETHPRRRPTLEKEYYDLTGVRLVPDHINYYLWSEDTNKRGAQIRISFRMNDNIPPSLRQIVKTARFSNGYHNARINGNKFMKLLIKYGFRASNTQNETLIRSKILPVHTSEFDNGFNL